MKAFRRLIAQQKFVIEVKLWSLRGSHDDILGIPVTKIVQVDVKPVQPRASKRPN